jgi:hypothetical protein
MRMNKVLLRSVGAAAAAVSLTWLVGSSASAMKPFRDEFMTKYVKPDSADAKENAFAEAVQAAKCNLCHQGKSKKEKNVYGRALNKFLGEEDMENREKIRSALDKAAELKSNPDDPNSPTFGDLIKAGKLPGGGPSHGGKKTGN